ncbi:hypothetical protein D2T31_12205 [Sinirhodobacter populi]|uniref:Uncharacterized protein n=1 Tax=Paenirhodobacter populi TaxID=2306993 RepID=A0A443K7X8_9RHOB|nr:hypothetical protein [Sinirhodobacter populi]RWR28868.1 hypothetical protein D2T31_12205 [Sinirhodobacter populi]
MVYEFKGAHIITVRDVNCFGERKCYAVAARRKIEDQFMQGCTRKQAADMLRLARAKGFKISRYADAQAANAAANR